MSQNRPPKQSPNQNAAVIETLRSASESARAGEESLKDKDKDKDDEGGIPVFWRVFGGTVISILSLVVMTAYNGFTSSLAETKADLASLTGDVRKEVARLDEGHAALIPRSDCETVMSTVWRNLNDLGGDHKELAALRERCDTLLARFKKGEAERRSLEDDLQKIREEQAADAERRALADEVGRLRERLASLEGKKAAAKIGN